MDGKWKVHSTNRVYDHDSCQVDLIEVELPDGSRVEHHVLHVERERFVNVLAHDADKGVLLIWRHRFIDNRWGWELPGAFVGESESVDAAARRALLETTGWQAGKLSALCVSHQSPELTSLRTEGFATDGVSWAGPGRDANVATDVAWTPVDQVRTIVAKGEMSDGPSLTTLLYALAFGPLKSPA